MKYWVVSPNVNNDHDQEIVSRWKKASIAGHAAFMGYEPDDTSHNGIGSRFAKDIEPGDVILIARRHNHRPDPVGFGVVESRSRRRIKGLKTPGHFGSVRILKPFIRIHRAPAGVPLIRALGQIRALARLHARSNSAHREICDWISRELSGKGRAGRRVTTGQTTHKTRQQGVRRARVAPLKLNRGLGYKVRTKAENKVAQKREAQLLRAYRAWLKKRSRKLSVLKFGRLQSDAFDVARRNIIEAKSTTSREDIRMAVGELLDYTFQAKKGFGTLNKALLLPRRPVSATVDWLRPLRISLVWREKRMFHDNADGRFT